MSELGPPSRSGPEAPALAAVQPQLSASVDLATVCRQTLDDYHACRRLLQTELKVQLPDLQSGQLTFRRETVTGWESLRQRLEEFAPQSGWIAWQCSGVGETPLVSFSQWDASLLQRLSDDNALLEAEFARGDAGLHLRLLGEDCWCWSEAGASGSAVVASMPAIVESVRHIGKKDAAFLDYRVGWLANRDGAEGGFQPRISYLHSLQTGDPA